MACSTTAWYLGTHSTAAPRRPGFPCVDCLSAEDAEGLHRSQISRNLCNATLRRLNSLLREGCAPIRGGSCFVLGSRIEARRWPGPTGNASPLSKESTSNPSAVVLINLTVPGTRSGAYYSRTQPRSLPVSPPPPLLTPLLLIHSPSRAIHDLHLDSATCPPHLGSNTVLSWRFSLNLLADRVKERTGSPTPLPIGSLAQAQ